MSPVHTVLTRPIADVGRTTCLVVLWLVLGPAAKAQGTSALDSARASVARGATSQAIALYQAVVRQDSTSRPALRELSALLSGTGRWQNALPLVRRLSALGVSDFSVERDLGQWMSWSGQADSGVVHLRKAAALAPDSLAVQLALGEALTWNPQTRGEGIAVLRALEQRTPTDPAVARVLAAALSWNPLTRAEGVKKYAALAHNRPNDLALLVDYADVLSWVSDTRPDALELYGRVSAADARNSRAMLGRLNVLTWTGRSQAALRLADSLLMASPSDTALLRSRGILLLQVGRPNEAVTVLRDLIARSPADPKLTEQLAYALLGAGRLREAHALAASLREGPTPGAADWVRRGSAPAVSVDFIGMHTSLGLTLNRVVATTSFPLSASARFSLSARPTWFDAPNGSFRSSGFSAALDGKLPGLTSARAEVGVERYPGGSDAWNGVVEGEAPLARGATLRGILRRAAVEDSRRAASGQTDSGTFVGQVRASTGALVLRVPDLPGKLTLTSTVSLGAYTGQALRTNQRREANTALVRAFQIGTSRLDVGAGISYLSFAFDANRSRAVAPANEVGGYWSPPSFGNVYSTLGVTVPVTGRLTFRADGALGRQIAGLQPGGSATNIAAGSELRLVGRHGWDASAGFLYLDNLGGFRLRQLRAGLRHAF